MSESLQSVIRQQAEALREQPEQLIEIIVRQAESIAQLQQENKKLQDQIRDLNDQNNDLSKRLEAVEKKAFRQAAPFRRQENQKVITPKKPGRKPGHPGASRKIPDHIDAEVMAPLEKCSHCGGQSFTAVRTVEQYIEDIPPVRPHVTHLLTEEGTCACCGETVRSQHPLQVSRAEGVAGVHLGPRALAVAAQLNKQHGLTMRRTCVVLKDLFGLSLTAGGLAQAVQRVAGKVKFKYDELVAQIPQWPVVHSDETSWWVSGPDWLWVFTCPTATVYQVPGSRGRAVIAAVLGENFAGVLVSDCLAVYDGVNARQQKCYSHHGKAIKEALQERPQSEYLLALRGMLHAALALKPLEAPAEQKKRLRQKLEQKAEELLGTFRADGVEEKVRQRLRKQKDHLFTFLDVAEVPATNNLAERQLRPAVIARKLSCGNKTDKGVRAWEILASLAATCQQQATSFLNLISENILLARPP